MSKFSKHKWWMLTVVLTAPVLAVAAGVPNVFTPGTVISSAQVNDNFKNLADRLTALEAAVRPATTYVRWGRSACPTGATVVYTGYAAGGHYTHTGSGSNTICLSDHPSWLMYDDGNQNGALIYGTEYKTSTYGVGGLVALDGQDATCAVCEVPRPEQLMIPGQTTCPTGWALEYAGYLMSSNYTQNKQDWVCVDAAADAAGSATNQTGHLFYPTEAECGSLPCRTGGYVQDREITCAVCTK